MNQLEWHDIQGFVRSSYAHLPCASYVLLRITDPQPAREWIKHLEGQITTAEKKQERFSLNIAFTATGLNKLGFTASELSTFSRAFAEGMVSEHRSRILGDTDDNEPSGWDWGDDDNAVDILLLVFAEDEHGLDDLLSVKFGEVESCGGLQIVTALAAGRQPDTKEHFGFEDGVGQPVIEGSGSEERQKGRTQHATILKAGEFILGYQNELKICAPLPEVRGMPMFGRNGTYLVFRQMEQDVAKFWNYLRDVTRRSDGTSDDDAFEYFAAKIVGRWRSGAPTTKYPNGDPHKDTPTISNENDFEYDEQDKNGFGCPVGSHIRRTNPRDSLGPDPATALESAKRHRIIRRGRSYGSRIENRFVADGVQRGLNFICLNADIERQFEFIQQTWVNNRTFAGLYDEVDPLIGKKGKERQSFTVQSSPVRRRIHDLQDFVKIRGGAYFFMPGIEALRHLALRSNLGVPAAPTMLEDPRHRLISARVSPMVEMARWIFELDNVPYAEEAHAPVVHILSTLKARGGYEVPVVVSPEGVWRGAREFLVNFDAKSPPSRRLLGQTEDERAENIAFVEQLFSLLLKQVRRYVYFHLLPHPRVLSPIVVEGAPRWERFVVEKFYPLWRRLMGKALDFSPNLIRDAPLDIDRAFTIVEERLAATGRRFFAGDEPGSLDVVFSSLAAPVIFPKQYGAMLPELEDVPVELRDFISSCRNRRAGELVLETYAVARTEAQKPLRFTRRSVSLPNFFFSRRARVLAAKILVRFAPRLIFGRFAVLSRWSDVQAVLKRDTEFLIAPINGERIEEINGPFVLGMDRGKVLEREQRQMYVALSTVNLDDVRSRVRAEAKFLLEAAQKTRERKIEVVNGYARLVAARTAISLFGVSGPSEAEYMRAVRWIFQHTFLNIAGDQKVRNKALAASKDLREWTLNEITRRQSGLDGKGDLMAALLAPRGADPEALDDDGVRRTLMGMLVGAVDTTATAVAHCTAVLLSNESLRKSALADVNEPEKFVGWCWEALRFHPHNAVLLRHAPAGTKIGGKELKRDTTVVLNTLGTMHDPEAFPDPHQMDPERPLKNYFHFGGGLHPCAGRAVNTVQVPELVGQLLLHSASKPETPRFDGPFIDELLVRL